MGCCDIHFLHKDTQLFAEPRYFLNFSDFEPRIIIKLFLNTKGLTSPN